MKSLLRYWRFNLVGALGMGVQLGSLRLGTHMLPGHYLWTSAFAVQLALVHNFVWHVRYTWRDRGREMSVWACLARFQLSNGVVSLVGNLLLMRILVRDAGLSVFAANLLAIACCSLFNFGMSDLWAFRKVTPVEC
jgi:putative flippase GtrA